MAHTVHLLILALLLHTLRAALGYPWIFKTLNTEMFESLISKRRLHVLSLLKVDFFCHCYLLALEHS